MTVYTNSKHSLPVAENILNRDFKADRPGQKMVSDITYIPTDEGWLYLAGVMDLCGNKIVGILYSAKSRSTILFGKNPIMVITIL